MPLKVRVSSPCTASWDRMVGDDRVRYCGECKLNVYNFSAMTEAEAAELIVRHEGRMCGRFYHRADGTMLTQNCPVGISIKIGQTSRAASAILAAILGTGYAAAQPRQNNPALVQIEQQTGEISLTVTDPSGATVEKANVLLVNQQSQLSFEGVTNPAGELHVLSMAPGSYVLTVQVAGFRAYQTMIEVSQGKTVEARVVLDIAATMGVLVTEEGPEGMVKAELLPDSLSRKFNFIETDVATPSPVPIPKKNIFKKLFSKFKQ